MRNQRMGIGESHQDMVGAMEGPTTELPDIGFHCLDLPEILSHDTR